jgi:guanylate kinase
MTADGGGFDGVERRGLMFVLSSPSGAGKTTLSRLLIERMPGLRMSVSATTRPMRPGEGARADVVSVFILPPSAADLEKRLHSRAQDSAEVIRGRMSRASHEMSHWAEYDYIVINHDIDEAFAEVQSILKAERLKRERRTGLTTFVRELQRQLQK